MILAAEMLECFVGASTLVRETTRKLGLRLYFYLNKNVVLFVIAKEVLLRVFATIGIISLVSLGITFVLTLKRRKYSYS